jgi:kynurenine formamidase
MQLLDITGPIYTGMWSYEAPYPKVKIEPIPQPQWVKTPVYSSQITGLCSQTGTYLETAAHIDPDAICVDALDLNDLFFRETVIINIPGKTGEREPIGQKELEASLGNCAIAPGTAIIVGTGWGQYWQEDFYLPHAPYFTYEAINWLLSWSPYLIGADIPRWDNLENPQGFWEELFSSGTLLLAPVVNIEQIKVKRCKLVVLPLKLVKTSAAPCRAVLVFE